MASPFAPLKAKQLAFFLVNNKRGPRKNPSKAEFCGVKEDSREAKQKKRHLFALFLGWSE